MDDIGLKVGEEVARGRDRARQPPCFEWLRLLGPVSEWTHNLISRRWVERLEEGRRDDGDLDSLRAQGTREAVGVVRGPADAEELDEGDSTHVGYPLPVPPHKGEGIC